MSITVLSSTNYWYSGQADSRSYTSDSGTNTLLLIGVSLQGFGILPASLAVTYNGVNVPGIVSDSIGGTDAALIYALANPASGTNTLHLNYSGGSNGGVNVAVYTLGNVSNAPVEQTTVTHVTSGVGGNWLDTLSLTPTSSNTLMFDVFMATNGGGINTYEGQTTNGISSYKSPTGLTQTTLYGSSTLWLRPVFIHVGALIRSNKDFSITDTVSIGNTGTTIKGLLIQLSDSVTLTESLSILKQIFITLTDTLTIKNRGWFGNLDFWNNTVKTVSTFINRLKN